MQPEIETGRLKLRSWTPEDAQRLVELAGDRRVADTMISIPHPYPLELAREWIASRKERFEAGRDVSFAVQFRKEPLVIGAIEVRDIERDNLQGELSFWIGVPYWGRGYAYEAVMAAVRFAFTQLRLNRICAHHMVRNAASGRVLEKAGFKREGLLRQRVRKWGVFEDVVVMALLHGEWEEELDWSVG
ncbi:MAG: GNAT family N-acetyltransferase [Verrucomicrobia bacterium]|nr:GNAT family N-acetyltransferase [Verrucomicrobiota bacterium]